MSDDGTYSYQMDAPVTEPPRRVVSLVPSVTESLYDLRLHDRLVGVTDACIYPKGISLPRLGDPQSPHIEAIRELAPDLVIANAEFNRAEDLSAIEDAGIPLWVTFPKTVSAAINLLWNMMQVFDETSMVPRVRLIEQTLDWILGVSRANENQAPRVFVPLGVDPLRTCSEDTYTHDLLRVCGGLNVFESGADRYPLVALEAVEAAQPDVILLPDNVFQETEAHIPLFAQLDVPAAREDRVFLVDGTLLSWPGTRLAYALDKLPTILGV